MDSSSRRAYTAVPLPIWRELLSGIEMVWLRRSPVYWGFGVPQGDGSGVVVIPGLLSSDFHCAEFCAWLARIGYRAYPSGVGLNAECPNLLLPRVAETIDNVYRFTRRRVHIVGHSLGGLLARVLAARMPERVSSVITLSSPFRQVAAHPAVLNVVIGVRKLILERHGRGVLSDCFTGLCTCDFARALNQELLGSVCQTAIYTKVEGMVDWRSCITGDLSIDCEVPSTHTGLIFNPVVYELVAHRLARAFRERSRCRGCPHDRI
jgi:triacylglycerol lipase